METLPTNFAFLREHDSLFVQLTSELLERTQSYGDYQRPEDYLDSFTQFIQEQVNHSAALSVVVSRPKDLTREQLRDIKLLLDEKGYTEATLQTAVRDQTNQDKRFRDKGGAKRLDKDKVLDQKLDTVLDALNDGLWVA